MIMSDKKSRWLPAAFFIWFSIFDLFFTAILKSAAFEDNI